MYILRDFAMPLQTRLFWRDFPFFFSIKRSFILITLSLCDHNQYRFCERFCFSGNRLLLFPTSVRQCRRFGGVSIIKSEKTSRIALLFPFLTLSK